MFTDKLEQILTTTLTQDFASNKHFALSVLQLVFIVFNWHFISKLLTNEKI